MELVWELAPGSRGGVPQGRERGDSGFFQARTGWGGTRGKGVLVAGARLSRHGTAGARRVQEPMVCSLGRAKDSDHNPSFFSF